MINKKIYNKKMLLKLAEYFAEHGIPKSYSHFKVDGKKPVSDKEMADNIGKYERMLELFKSNHKEYWDLAQPTKATPEPVKQDPLESLRASTTEK